MGLEMSDFSGEKFDKSKSGSKGGVTASSADAFWQLLGVVLAFGLVSLVAYSSEDARTVPIESYTPGGSRVYPAVESR